MMIRKIVTILALAVVIGGCAPPPYWTLTDDLNQVVTSHSFKMIVPEGWNRSTTADTYDYVTIDGKDVPVLLERMVASRDGFGINAISVTRRYPDTAFPAIKKKSTANMLPNEAADLYVSDLRKRSGLERLKVLSNKPARVAGKPGFEVAMQFKNDDGLRIRIVSHGFVDKTGLYTINYRAPYLYYYKRDYGAYIKVVHSFKEMKGAFDPPPQMPAWAKLFT
ncbi:MAG: hypothetical protein P8164_12880 [Gammaproteobacteria bacterium]|jgi:hypothetical protein